MTIDLSTLPAPTVSVRADAVGDVRSIRFEYDGKAIDPPQNLLPYTIHGDQDGKCVPWVPAPGEHRIVATPYPEPQGKGTPGKPLAVKFTVAGAARGVAPEGETVVLSGWNANFHGAGLRLEGDGGERNVAGWSKKDDYLDWTVLPPEAGMYEVEVVYACAPENGGTFEVKVGDTRLPGVCKPTGGWDEYRAIRIGKVKLKQNRKATLILKPKTLAEGKALMNVRTVRLILVK
jgi:hypothetical protein